MFLDFVTQQPIDTLYAFKEKINPDTMYMYDSIHKSYRAEFLKAIKNQWDEKNEREISLSFHEFMFQRDR